MKKLFLALALCLGLVPMIGCYADEGMYIEVPIAYTTGTVEFCDDWGCRYLTAPYYYMDGEVVYWDAHFGCWIGPRGWWRSGIWYRGWVEGYHGWYGERYYHYSYSHPGGWRAGSGYHGYRGGGHRR